jgi:hypothetical protein
MIFNKNIVKHFMICILRTSKIHQGFYTLEKFQSLKFSMLVLKL